MKSKSSMILVSVLAMAFAVSCAKKASQDDLLKVCAHMMSLQQAENPQADAEDPVAQVAADFQAKEQELDKGKQEAVVRLDEECAAAAAALATDEEKATAEADCKAKKDALAAEFGRLADQMKTEKEAATAAAVEAKSLADKAVAEKADKDLKACTDNLVKARTSKAKADCQLKAKTLAEFGACK